MRKPIASLVLATCGILLQTGCPAMMPGDDDMTNGANGNGATSFVAEMSGSQEVPEVTTDASGTGNFNLNADETEVGFDISASGLTSPVIGLHIHSAAAGQNGDIVFSLTDSLVETGEGSVGAGGAFAITADQVAALRAGEYYLNLHTEENPAGEIRGQLVPLDPN